MLTTSDPIEHIEHLNTYIDKLEQDIASYDAMTDKMVKRIEELETLRREDA